MKKDSRRESAISHTKMLLYLYIYRIKLGLMLINGIALQLVGLVLDFSGALLLTVSEIKSRSEIKKEAGTYVGSNPHLKKSLKQKSLFSIIAAFLLVLGFVLQIIGILISSGWINVSDQNSTLSSTSSWGLQFLF